MSDLLSYLLLSLSVITPAATAAFMYSCWKAGVSVRVKDCLFTLAGIVPVLNILILIGLLFVVCMNHADDVVFRGRE